MSLPLVRLDDLMEFVGFQFSQLLNCPKDVSENTLVVVTGMNQVGIFGYVVEDVVDEATTILYTRQDGEVYLEDVAVPEREFVIAVISNGCVGFKKWRGKELAV